MGHVYSAAAAWSKRAEREYIGDAENGSRASWSPLSNSVIARSPALRVFAAASIT